MINGVHMKFVMGLALAFAFSSSAYAAPEVWNCSGIGARYYDYAHPERNTTAAGKPYDGRDQFQITVDQGLVTQADGVAATNAGFASVNTPAPDGGKPQSQITYTADDNRVYTVTLILIENDTKDAGNLGQRGGPSDFQNYECAIAR
jgi:hypothetical protein